jgi:electron transfer flavoprotein alpha/beta subunit
MIIHKQVNLFFFENKKGQILSSLLNWNLASFASKLQINDKTIEVTKEVKKN